MIANAGTYVAVTVFGNVTADGYTNAVGVHAENLGGAVDVDIDGDVRAVSPNGRAVGVESVAAYGNNTVTIGGNVYVKGATAAYGVMAEGGNIDVEITGDVTAIATAGAAVGVESVGDNTVHIGGNVSVTAAGNAFGVAVGGIDGYAYVGGNVTAISTTSGGTKTDGFYGNATGDIGAHIVGSVYAKGVDGITIGVGGLSTAGNVTLYVGGDVYAGSTHGTAAGVIGEIQLREHHGQRQCDRARLYRGGRRGSGWRRQCSYRRQRGLAYAQGNTYGVVVGSTGGYAYVGGNVVAISTTSAATKTDGFYGNATGDISGHIDGNVYAKSVVDGTTIGAGGPRHRRQHP